MLANAFVLALRELQRNVMRSVLTILGVVIGVAAVIVMVTVGNGATVQVTQQIASMGSNLLMVTTGRRVMGPMSSGAMAFRVEDAQAIQRNIGSLLAVAPTASRSVAAISGNNNWSTTVTGTTEAFFTARNWSLERGRIFNESENRAGTAVCIIGKTLQQKLFGSRDPVGDTLRLERLSCNVIGLLKEKGQSMMGTDQDDLVIVPLRTFQRRVSGTQDINVIQIAVREGASTDRVKRDIEQLLRARRHLSARDENNFSVMDMQEIAQMFTSTTRVLTALLAAVAAVSLLVGGIGIMNIMLVSVTERTREIGIRLAIGALEREVLLQFLVEAMVLSSLGGLVGIALALISSYLIAGMLNIPFVFNAGITTFAFVFSAIIGVGFGYFPARKAAQLNPIEALRHE